MTVAIRIKAFFLAVCLMIAAVESCPAATAGSRVTFNEEGIAHVNGKPFFPLGVFTYELNSEVLAELHEVQCNTILNGFAPNQLAPNSSLVRMKLLSYAPTTFGDDTSSLHRSKLTVLVKMCAIGRSGRPSSSYSHMTVHFGRWRNLSLEGWINTSGHIRQFSKIV